KGRVGAGGGGAGDAPRRIEADGDDAAARRIEGSDLGATGARPQYDAAIGAAGRDLGAVRGESERADRALMAAHGRERAAARDFGKAYRAVGAAARQDRTIAGEGERRDGARMRGDTSR